MCKQQFIDEETLFMISQQEVDQLDSGTDKN
jgi:hypothetical protein